MHWAAKHGNGDIVKLIAGTYKADVNERTVSDKILLSAHHFWYSKFLSPPPVELNFSAISPL